MFVECIRWTGYYNGCCANCKWHDQSNKCNLVRFNEPAEDPPGNPNIPPPPGWGGQPAIVQPPPIPVAGLPAVVHPPMPLLQLPPLLPVPPSPAQFNPFLGFQVLNLPVQNPVLPGALHVPAVANIGLGNAGPHPGQHLLLPPPDPVVQGVGHTANNPIVLDLDGGGANAPVLPMMGNIGADLVQSPAVLTPPALPVPLAIPASLNLVPGASRDNAMEIVDDDGNGEGSQMELKQEGDTFQHGGMRGLPLYSDGVRLWDGQGSIQQVQTRRLQATTTALRDLRAQSNGPMYNEGQGDQEAAITLYFEQGHLLAAMNQELQRRLTIRLENRFIGTSINPGP